MADTRIWSPGFKNPFKIKLRLVVTFGVKITFLHLEKWKSSASSWRGNRRLIADAAIWDWYERAKTAVKPPAKQGG